MNVAQINLGQSLLAQLQFLFLPDKEDNGPYQTCNMFRV